MGTNLKTELSQQQKQAATVLLARRVVMGSDSLALLPKLWLEVLQTELTPMTAHFAHKLASAKREANLHGPALRASLKLLSKALLHYLSTLASEPGFPEMWAGLLQLLQVSLPGLLTERLSMR